MFRSARRTDRLTGVRFCDGCAEVTTTAQRARRRHERTVLWVQTLLGRR